MSTTATSTAHTHISTSIDDVPLTSLSSDQKPHLNPKSDTLFSSTRLSTSNEPTGPESKALSSSPSSSPSPPELEPVASFPTLQKWNHPRGNISRLLSTFYSMLVFGLNDGAWGALIPYFERYYSISYTVVSLIFLCPFAGYTIAAFTNSWFHTHFGQRSIAILAPITHLITYITLSLHPPWPVVVAITSIGGFGNGLIDGAWSSWAGHMVAGNVLEGSLHAFYALGATMAPLIVTSMVVRRGLEWYCFYYMMSGLACVALVVCGCSFWRKTGAVYRDEHPGENTTTTTINNLNDTTVLGVDENRTKCDSTTKQALKNRVTWLCSAFFLLYVGAEVALGGWIVSFMLHVRNASPYVSGITATGFWAGMTFGRSALGVLTHSLIELTNRPITANTTTTNADTDDLPSSLPYKALFHLQLTERSIVSSYLLLAITTELLFWLIPSITASAVAVAFLGMFLGPIFPSGIIMATKLLPAHLHVASIGFSTALGGTGGAVFPFVVGAIAQRRGVEVLQPIIIAMLVVLLGLWWCFPRVDGKVKVK